jgi:hypothetical protein
MGEARADWAIDVDTHRVVRGRRWRVSDPRIPEPLRQALVDELMSARRAVKAGTDAAAERVARGRVRHAKVAAVASRPESEVAATSQRRSHDG